LYSSKNHCKFYLKAHLIFATKYRRKILRGKIGKQIKTIIGDISNMSDFDVEEMEVDKDHIHLLVSYLPSQSISSIVNRLKSISTNRIWKLQETHLRKYYWYENFLWSDGYFVFSIGEASTETIRKYIQQQG
jgi:putative transposase